MVEEKIVTLLKEVERIMSPYNIYAVGGCVRDSLLGVEPKDYDFCTNASPDEIEEKVKADGKRAYLTGKRFGTIGFKIEYEGKFEMIEVTTFRTEEYEKGNRKPDVKFVKNIQIDLGRRDFTINAMAMRLTNDGKLRLIDPHDGEEDLLKWRLIRCVGNPKMRFKEDPLRMLRAIRFSCRFNYEIEQKTMEKMMSGAIQILNISKERWMMELDKILQSENVERGLMDLWQSNLFKFMIPELELMSDYDQNSQYHPWKLDVHTIKVVEAVRKETDDLNMLWAGLLHDIAKPFIRTNKTLKTSGEQLKQGRTYKSNYIGHEILGAEMVNRIATHLNWSKERHEKVVELVRNHLENDCPLRKFDQEGKK
ncbi:HD domain-containing protein [Candidatus Pacearchaeota archaeon]|nr:HD domain-containing protein [Candidatus Pacearchaeota archaeon]